MSSKGTRSPNSPSRSLEGCFDDAMKLYDCFPQSSFDSIQIASVLGCSSNSGAFRGLLADLKQFGLIERNPSGEFVVSQALKDMSVMQGPERDAIKYGFATSPKVFSQIIENLGHHLPDASTLANVLVARFGFNKAKATKTAKALHESLEWANAIDARGNVVPPAADSGDGPQSAMTDEASDGIVNEPRGDNVASHCEEGSLNVDVPVKDGRVVRILYPQDLTAEEASKVGAVLSAIAR